MSHDLLFLRPKFHLGLNVTVRNGTKWMAANPGDTLHLRRTHGREELARGRVVGTIPVNLQLTGARELLEMMLPKEHDPACRTMHGLTEAMDAAYGSNRWGPRLTVLVFFVDEIHPFTDSNQS